MVTQTERAATREIDETAFAPEIAEPEFLTRVRLRAQLRVRFMRRVVWKPGEVEAAQGMAIPHGEVDRALGDPAEALQAEARFFAHDAEALRILRALEPVEHALRHDPRWKWLAQEFHLSQAEIDLLSLSVAAEVSPALCRVYGYLHDDVAACHPSQALAAALFGWPSATMVGADSPLVRWRMAWPAESAVAPWSALAAWTPDPYLVSWFQNQAAIDPVLSRAARYVPPSDAPELCLYPEVLGELREFTAALESSRAPMVVEIVGPHGSGKMTLAAQLAESLEAGLLAIDAAALLTNDAGMAGERPAAEKMMRAIRMARLAGAVLYWHELDAVPPAPWAGVEGLAPPMGFGSPAPASIPWRSAVLRKTLRMPSLARAAAIALWSRLTAEEPV